MQPLSQACHRAPSGARATQFPLALVAQRCCEPAPLSSTGVSTHTDDSLRRRALSITRARPTARRRSGSSAASSASAFLRRARSPRARRSRYASLLRPQSECHPFVSRLNDIARAFCTSTIRVQLRRVVPQAHSHAWTAHVSPRARSLSYSLASSLTMHHHSPVAWVRARANRTRCSSPFALARVHACLRVLGRASRRCHGLGSCAAFSISSLASRSWAGRRERRTWQ